jgi:hypothetical protein
MPIECCDRVFANHRVYNRHKLHDCRKRHREDINDAGPVGQAADDNAEVGNVGDQFLLQHILDGDLHLVQDLNELPGYVPDDDALFDVGNLPDVAGPAHGLINQIPLPAAPMHNDDALGFAYLSDSEPDNDAVDDQDHDDNDSWISSDEDEDYLEEQDFNPDILGIGIGPEADGAWQNGGLIGAVGVAPLLQAGVAAGAAAELPAGAAAGVALPAEQAQPAEEEDDGSDDEEDEEDDDALPNNLNNVEELLGGLLFRGALSNRACGTVLRVLRKMKRSEKLMETFRTSALPASVMTIKRHMRARFEQSYINTKLQHFSISTTHPQLNDQTLHIYHQYLRNIVENKLYNPLVTNANTFLYTSEHRQQPPDVAVGEAYRAPLQVQLAERALAEFNEWNSALPDHELRKAPPDALVLAIGVKVAMDSVALDSLSKYSIEGVYASMANTTFPVANSIDAWGTVAFIPKIAIQKQDNDVADASMKVPSLSAAAKHDRDRVRHEILDQTVWCQFGAKNSFRADADKLRKNGIDVKPGQVVIVTLYLASVIEDNAGRQHTAATKQNTSQMFETLPGNLSHVLPPDADADDVRDTLGDMRDQDRYRRWHRVIGSSTTSDNEKKHAEQKLSRAGLRSYLPSLLSRMHRQMQGLPLDSDGNPTRVGVFSIHTWDYLHNMSCGMIRYNVRSVNIYT